LDLLLKKLLQSSKSGIELLLAIAGTLIQVFAAFRAKTLAVLLAQQLGIQIQDKDCPHNVIQIGTVSLQREYPFVFVFLVGKLRHQHHFNGKANLPVKGTGAPVADSVDGGGNFSLHHQNPRGVSHRALSQNRLGYGVAHAIAKITQINADGKGKALSGTVNDLGKP